MIDYAEMLAHYEHARRKHPYFADKLTTEKLDDLIRILELLRHVLRDTTNYGKLVATTVLECEVAELEVELAKGNTDRAIQEALDAIAVLLRIIDVLRGEQKLGKPEEDAK